MEIKAGAELDLAVAEACGVKGWIESLRNEVTGYESPERFVLADSLETVFWEPSTDLNDAFSAAERAGMFLELNCLADGWMATTHAMRGKSPSIESTPSLAICAAILELAKANH